jgi:hypothetical protein
VALVEEVKARPPVSVTIEGAPKNTEVLTEDGPVGRAPRVELKWSAHPVTVVFRAEGYEPWTQVLIPDRDQTIVARLVKIVSKQTRATSSKRPVAPVKVKDGSPMGPDDLIDLEEKGTVQKAAEPPP